MLKHQRYDILIIGSGEAGEFPGWTMAKASRRTAVVERALIGSCPDIVLFAAVPVRAHTGAGR